MFHGPIAAAGLLESPGSSGNTTIINFLSESYSVNGTSYSASDIIDTPANVGASGLACDGTSVVSIIGDLLTALLAADWTMTVEWEELSDTGRTYLIILESADETEELAILRDLSIEMKADESSPATGTGLRVLNDPESGTGPFLSGIHKVSLTRTTTRFAMSADGRTVTSVDDFGGSTVTAFNLVNAAFGGYPDGFTGNAVNIRSLVLQAPVDDADLPSLSA